MKKFTSTLATFLLCVVVFSQDVTEQMKDLINAYGKEAKFNGVALVTKKGEVVFEGGFGYRNAESKTPLAVDDVFQIGSITKQITAAVIIKLQEEGRLSVKDKLNKYFDGFANGHRITIEHLLTHTSGIFNYTNDEKIMEADVTKHYSQKEMLDIFRAYKPDFEPGEKWNYSNSAYSILGYIIEKTTGKSYERVVREKIFQPLGMTNSGFDFTHLAVPNKAKGYFALAGNPVASPVVDSTIAYSAGAVYSTVKDLAKWERAVTQGKLLKPSSWIAVFTPFKNKYGYGWSIDSAFGKRFTAHSGGIHGFASYLIRFPEEELSVIMIDNASSRSLGKMSMALSAIALGQPYEKPKARSEINVDKSILQQYVGEYQLSPTFSINVTFEGNSLKAQATNQPQFDLYAESENFFFLKVVDAQVEFIKDATGKVTDLILYQNGAKQKARKTN